MTDEHLSDERLSAHLDEVLAPVPADAPDVEQHLSGCVVCRRRLAALHSARSLVAAPVAPVAAEVRAQAVATALRAAPEMDALAPQRHGTHAEKRILRWYRRPQLLFGAAAAVVLLGLALPLALLGSSSSSSVSSERAASTHGAASTLGRGSGGSAAAASPGALGPLNTSGAGGSESAAAPYTVTPSVPDLGSVSSVQQVVQRLGAATAARTSSQSAYANANGGSDNVGAQYESCVASTRTAVNGGPYGPGVVATATYRGHATLVMEFWPTTSAPPAGKSLVAVSTTGTCRLLARTTM